MSSVYECGICIGTYSEEEMSIPRVLSSCGHTYCTKCLEQISGTFDIRCPHCRTVTILPNRNYFNLPKNYLILDAISERTWHISYLNMNEVREEYKGEEELDIPCDNEGNGKSAIYCIKCETSLCIKCYKLTHDFHFMKDHEIVKVSKKPPKAARCPLHPKVIADFYCVDQRCRMTDKVFCSTCHRIGSHKHHSSELIQNKCDEMRKKIDNQINHYVKEEKKLEDYTKYVDSVLQTFDEDNEEYIEKKEQIENYYGKIRAELDQCESDAFTELIGNRRDILQTKEPIVNLKKRIESQRNTLTDLLAQSNEELLKSDIDETINQLEYSMPPPPRNLINCGSIILEFESLNLTCTPVPNGRIVVFHLTYDEPNMSDIIEYMKENEKVIMESDNRYVIEYKEHRIDMWINKKEIDYYDISKSARVNVLMADYHNDISKERTLEAITNDKFSRSKVAIAVRKNKSNGEMEKQIRKLVKKKNVTITNYNPLDVRKTISMMRHVFDRAIN